ncbi:hypothetical protein EKG35_11375 [Lysinibacillus telephonicus]|uniref:Copper resistance protein CopC n=2 Tax=Lysinibacillus telephonicus TaxID=1714840 RepID=A0A3S0JW81_9BACI|nr:hypothetical protein EKG35_11375 [Lysinibacillus telephonicus]
MIKVFNEQQQEILSESGQISENRKEISIQIPNLENGKYKVEYYVISSNDGHPIQGSYYFKVNVITTSTTEPVKGAEELQTELPEMEQIEPNQSTSNIVEDNQPVNADESSKEESQKQTIIEKFNPSELLIYIMKTIYFFGLLLLIGWVLIWQIVRSNSLELKKKYLLYGIVFQIIHLAGLTSVILIQLNIFTIHGVSLSFNFPIDSSFGFLWFTSLFISLLGLMILYKNRWFDLFFIFAIVVSKSLNSHAAEFDPVPLLVIADCIHLLAASFWAAGLVYILLFWRKQRLYVKSFLPIFSTYALISFVLLTVTGSVMAMNFLPNIEALRTPWGILLLVKIILVCIVIFIGSKVRLKMKNNQTVDLGRWITFDFLLMCFIVIVVAILTYLNPLP